MIGEDILVKVNFKRLDVDMEVKNNGFELEIRTPDGSAQLGDLVITKSKITWCKGRQSAENGVTLSWEKFIELMEAQR